VAGAWVVARKIRSARRAAGIAGMAVSADAKRTVINVSSRHERIGMNVQER
jgi:hypothetical protein